MSSVRPESAQVQSQAESRLQSHVPGVDPIAPPLTSPPIMSQRWCDLAFLHWFVQPARVQSWMPPGATPDVVPSGPFAGLTPVALVPFRMVDAGFGRGPAVPYFGTFWETNVRLYSVDATGTHGIVFCSLDASRLAVVLAARLTLGLPYRFSRMRGHERTRDGSRELAWTASTRWPGPRGIRSRIAIRVGEPLPEVAEDPSGGPASTRWPGPRGIRSRIAIRAGEPLPEVAEDPSGGPASTRWPGPRGIRGRIAIRAGEPLPEVAEDPSGGPASTSQINETTGRDVSLVTFLTARWGLHTSVWGRTMYVPNVHETWSLRSAEVLLLDDGLLGAAGFDDLATRPPDHVCFAEGVHTRFGLPSVLRDGRPGAPQTGA